jgi:hypothetical protein
MDGRLPWTMRRMALFAAVRQAVTGRHVYLSTGCLAGDHGYCKSMTGMQGAKRGGRAKFSNAPCICRCHHRRG